jgi:uncharacterized protein YutD
MKLTPTQKEVIKRMREGAQLYCNMYCEYYLLTNTLNQAHLYDVNKLMVAGIIEHKERLILIDTYKLTAKGRKIEI